VLKQETIIIFFSHKPLFCFCIFFFPSSHPKIQLPFFSIIYIDLLTMQLHHNSNIMKMRMWLWWLPAAFLTAAVVSADAFVPNTSHLLSVSSPQQQQQQQQHPILGHAARRRQASNQQQRRQQQQKTHPLVLLKSSDEQGETTSDKDDNDDASSSSSSIPRGGGGGNNANNNNNNIRSQPPPLPTWRDYQKFALPCLGLWVSQPLLSLVDTAFVGLSGGAASSASNLAALGPATTFFDGATYLFAFLNVAATNLYSTALAKYGENAEETVSVVQTASRIAMRCGLGLMVFLWLLARPLLALYIGALYQALFGCC
jgi:hypothetical protein